MYFSKLQSPDQLPRLKQKIYAPQGGAFYSEECSRGLGNFKSWQRWKSMSPLFPEVGGVGVTIDCCITGSRRKSPPSCMVSIVYSRSHGHFNVYQRCVQPDTFVHCAKTSHIFWHVHRILFLWLALSGNYNLFVKLSFDTFLSKPKVQCRQRHASQTATFTRVQFSDFEFDESYTNL